VGASSSTKGPEKPLRISVAASNNFSPKLRILDAIESTRDEQRHEKELKPEQFYASGREIP
jgi:hypothetical protein